jgi:DnaJ-class molecular chaperone
MAAEGDHNDSFYAVLNVARDASDEEIKRRYRLACQTPLAAGSAM